MNVLLLAQALNSPSTRFRLLLYLERMERAGIRYVLSPLPSPKAHPRTFPRAGFHAKEVLSRARALSRIGDFDVVVLQKKLTSLPLRGLHLLLRSARGRILYDFDDAVFLPHEGILTGAKGKLLQAKNQTKKLTEMSKVVTAGNNYLAEFARRYCDRVHLVLTAVDLENLKPREKPARAPVVGWSGSASTNRYLNLIAPALERAWRKHRFKVLVMSNSTEGLELGAMPFEFRPWSPETEAETIAQLDVGLGPLPHDDWARGKCALKLLQYMACEVATVASPVGANADVIRHRQNGLLADSLDEWEEALNQLIENAPLRRKLGKAGRATVIEHYSVDVVWPKFLAALEEAAR